MSPNDVEVLLHCHCVAISHPRADAPAVADALKIFETMGAIEKRVDGSFYTTPLGAAWVKAICNVPLPRVAFLGTDGNEIGDS